MGNQDVYCYLQSHVHATYIRVRCLSLSAVSCSCYLYSSKIFIVICSLMFMLPIFGQDVNRYLQFHVHANFIRVRCLPLSAVSFSCYLYSVKMVTVICSFMFMLSVFG